MAHDPNTALANTSSEELDALCEANDLLASPDDLQEGTYDWEPATYGRPKNPLPGLAQNAPISFFHADVIAGDLVIAVADRPGTETPYVIWAGSPDQAAETFAVPA